MGGGGRGRMAGTTGGMLSGILSGVFWGSVVGGLVLLLAALVLDLDLDLGSAPAGPDAPGEQSVAMPVEAASAIGVAPVLLRRLDGLLPPSHALDWPAVVPDPRRSLVPRPAQPRLPQLVTGAAVPVPHADSPPLPTAPVAVPRTERPDIPALPVATSGPTTLPPLTDPAGGTVPAAPANVRPAQAVPRPPAAPAQLIVAPLPPRVGPPPGATAIPSILPGPADLMPARDRLGSLADPTTPGRPAAPDAPPGPGPQVAFILDGPTDAPAPDWLRARTLPGDGAALRLDRGGAVFAGGDAVAGYLAARDEGAPALLAYARLDAADEADVAFDRIAVRARRDGAVAVLVAPDPALWDRIDGWLKGPARDLVPVAAGLLLD